MMCVHFKANRQLAQCDVRGLVSEVNCLCDNQDALSPPFIPPLTSDTRNTMHSSQKPPVFSIPDEGEHAQYSVSPLYCILFTPEIPTYLLSLLTVGCICSVTVVDRERYESLIPQGCDKGSNALYRSGAPVNFQSAASARNGQATALTLERVG